MLGRRFKLSTHHGYTLLYLGGTPCGQRMFRVETDSLSDRERRRARLSQTPPSILTPSHSCIIHLRSYLSCLLVAIGLFPTVLLKLRRVFSPFVHNSAYPFNDLRDSESSSDAINKQLLRIRRLQDVTRTIRARYSTAPHMVLILSPAESSPLLAAFAFRAAQIYISMLHKYPICSFQDIRIQGCLTLTRSPY